ncbi:MAG: SPOR domain-containing protein [Proteobacteria bacterium]|jgi:DedD protein|nr:SPOR domain-containing protein [Pseudomonadota bacterium]
MNKNISEEELLLRKRARRRLVGAIVLVLAAVIILPAIFDEPKSGSEKQEIAINLPPGKTAKIDVTPKEELINRELPNEEDTSPELSNRPRMGASTHDEFAGTSGEHKRIPIPGIKPKIDRRLVAAAPETKNASAAKAAQTAAPAPATAATAATIPDSAGATPAAPAADTAKSFVVQLGAFSDPVKAKQQQANLLANGFKAYTETLRVDHNEVTRVRLGPFMTRSAAEAELKKLKKIGLDGVVAPK